MDPKTIADCLAANIDYGLRAGYVSTKDLSALFKAMAEEYGTRPLDKLFMTHLHLMTKRIEEKNAKQQKLPEGA